MAADDDISKSPRTAHSGDSEWSNDSGMWSPFYYDGDAAKSGPISDSEESWMQTIVDVNSQETIKFYWKVSSESNSDYLQFYIDDTLKAEISGEVDWQQKSYTVSSGIHTLKWRYVKDESGYDGEDCGWVDFVQWTGPSPEQDTSNWQTINYKHDPAGRRIEKKIDGYSTRYCYDGPHVVAEYDGNNNLLRKYIYGPGIDQPVCMIEVADSNAVYYYHYDALGSVVALSDGNGDIVQTYEYSVYGQVAAEDPNHPNPYMFTGRRFDIELGLYYYRARYYNPFMGRFLQTDPIGYGAGMNLYRYCTNNPLSLRDPFGLDPNKKLDPCDPCAFGHVLRVLESIGDLGSDLIEGLVSIWNGAATKARDAVGYILEDIVSHTDVNFYVIGPNGIRLPVKVFESRSEKSGIPGLAGVSMNIGGEIHIGPEMADRLIQAQLNRDCMGNNLEDRQDPIYTRRSQGTFTSASSHGTYDEFIMAHEIGHQVDADNFPILYQSIGLIPTLDQDSYINDFEDNAWNRGDYNGIDWNYNP